MNGVSLDFHRAKRRRKQSRQSISLKQISQQKGAETPLSRTAGEGGAHASVGG